MNIPYTNVHITFKKDSTFQEFIDLGNELKKYGVSLEYDLIIDKRIVYCDVMIHNENLNDVFNIIHESDNVEEVVVNGNDL